MTSNLDHVLADLKSNDGEMRAWAAVEAGNYGAEAAELLPDLLDMMDAKLDDLPPRHWGEFVSVGRILHAIEGMITDGTASDDIRNRSDQTIERVLEFLDKSHGAAVSLLIRILVVTGPRMAEHASRVLAATVRDSDPRLRYRAYQFAYAVNPALLSIDPWNTFSPSDPEEREKWERAAFDP